MVLPSDTKLFGCIGNSIDIMHLISTEMGVKLKKSEILCHDTQRMGQEDFCPPKQSCYSSVIVYLALRLFPSLILLHLRLQLG